MGGELDQEDGRIGGTDVGEAVDLEVRVDDAALRLQEHRARARRMVLGADRVREPLVPVVVRLHGAVGGDLVADCPAERGRVADLARESRCSRNRTVSVLCERYCGSITGGVNGSSEAM